MLRASAHWEITDFRAVEEECAWIQGHAPVIKVRTWSRYG